MKNEVSMSEGYGNDVLRWEMLKGVDIDLLLRGFCNLEMADGFDCDGG